MKVDWPGPITAGECQRVLDLMDDPDPAISDEGYRQFFDHYLAGRLLSTVYLQNCSAAFTRSSII